LNPTLKAGTVWVGAALLSVWCVGLFGRGYWTPDEPREADIAWRMSWQTEKAVPLLAGEPFCEKPPLTYWLAAGPIARLGSAAGVARLPNLLYAIISALAVAALARRAAGPVAAIAAAAAIGSFLLAYQVAIWLATDAPLLAAVAVALLGQYVGFYADNRRDRLLGYCTMHIALGLGFLAKSAAVWVVPVLCFLVLLVWERRLQELKRWELYLGLIAQAAIVLAWVACVWVGPDGATHLKVFFWNNLVGRVARVDAPAELQYAAAHRNSPGKYLIELPMYLWPWTLLVLAAGHRAWCERRQPPPQRRAVRFALAASVPALVLLSFAATARNIYLAPALPGAALLLGWWIERLTSGADRWDRLALRATAVLIGVAIAVFAIAVAVLALIAPPGSGFSLGAAVTATLGFTGAVLCVGVAWRALGRARLLAAPFALLLGYCALLVGPAACLYARVDDWQDLAAIGRALRADLGTRPLILFTPDETTRAWVDMYTRSTVLRVPGPADASAVLALRSAIAAPLHPWVLVQLPGRGLSPEVRDLARRLRLERAIHDEADPTGALPAPAWAGPLGLRVIKLYALPNGRRYAILDSVSD
jgi:4-amino-4-deoxy-L-arabinose transferase-like glycosyltransferase